jgi:hypothetical protein
MKRGRLFSLRKGVLLVADVEQEKRFRRARILPHLLHTLLSPHLTSIPQFPFFFCSYGYVVNFLFLKKRKGDIVCLIYAQ